MFCRSTDLLYACCSTYVKGARRGPHRPHTYLNVSQRSHLYTRLVEQRTYLHTHLVEQNLLRAEYILVLQAHLHIAIV